MSPRDNDTLELLDGLADDPTVSKTMSRRAILTAINVAADAHRGKVTAAWVRPHLPSWVNPSQVGAVVSALTRAGVLEETSEIHESGNAQSRNGTRLMKVYRRVCPIDPDVPVGRQR